jgi:polysaccharide export outer membrane protein
MLRFFSLTSALFATLVVLVTSVFAQDAPPKAVPVDLGPLLKSGDAISMEVFGEPDLTTQTRILKSGEVVFPLIETVKVGGLTVAETIEKVRGLYAAKYLRNPKVRITVDDYATQFFSVIGSVNSPGQFPMPPSGTLDLATAVATAGGLGELADRRKIVLTRADGRSSTYTAQQAETGGRVALGPGDRVVVHQSGFVGKTVTLLGQVRKPGPLPIPLDGKLDIVAAIAGASGFTELANPKKVTVNRNGRVTLLDLREMTKQGNRNYYLQPDDIITVAERLF